MHAYEFDKFTDEYLAAPAGRLRNCAEDPAYFARHDTLARP